MKFGRVSLLFPVNFNSIFLPQLCILAAVNGQRRGVSKQLSDKSDLTWADFENVIDHLLVNITKGPNYSATRDFVNFLQGDMDFANCLTSFPFIDRIVTSCIGLFVQGPWF